MHVLNNDPFKPLHPKFQNPKAPKPLSQGNIIDTTNSPILLILTFSILSNPSNPSELYTSAVSTLW